MYCASSLLSAPDMVVLAMVRELIFVARVSDFDCGISLSSLAPCLVKSKFCLFERALLHLALGFLSWSSAFA